MAFQTARPSMVEVYWWPTGHQLLAAFCRGVCSRHLTTLTAATTVTLTATERCAEDSNLSRKEMAFGDEGG